MTVESPPEVPASSSRLVPMSADRSAGSVQAISAGTNSSRAVEKVPQIWILDDDERLCELLSGRLHQIGWDSTVFLESRALDEALRERTPDLLVLDEMLPGRRGTDLLAGLRQQGHRFPVLMLSAMRSAFDRIAGLEAGADDYLGKPFEFRELQLRIERLLDLRGSGREFVPPEAGSYRLAGLVFHVASAELRSVSGEVEHISRGDAALLQTLCRRPGEVIGRQVLARASGSLVDARQSRSIDVRMSRLRRLLQRLLPEEGEVIEACRGVGYRLLLPASPLAEP